jgi:peroxiredoxin
MKNVTALHLERRPTGLWNLLAFLPVAASFALAVTSAAQEVDLQWLAAGARDKLGGYMPQRLKLTTNAPVALKKAPADLAAPLYGQLQIGPKESSSSFLVVIDEPDDKAARLFLDINGNGDLTDDPPVQWKERKTPGQGGKEFKAFEGDLTVKIPYSTGTTEAHLFVYRFDKNDPTRAQFKEALFYYRDYAWSGSVKLDGKTYPALLVDDLATGDFRGGSGSASGVNLLLDLNDDKKFDMRREGYDIKKPFNIGGKTWEIANMTASGRFKIVASTETAEERRLPPNLNKGAKVTSFTAKTTDGKTVKFPDDYKGKVVLLDFWATWCGPCVAEIPNVVQNYGRHHEHGFEILGISLDREKAEEKLASFTKEKNMPWPQVYDGKWWQAEVAKLYGIDSIPRMLLVDGDTGEILAGAEVRGERLGPSIESALEKKRAK